jgi:hypothetical protein
MRLWKFDENSKVAGRSLISLEFFISETGGNEPTGTSPTPQLSSRGSVATKLT